MDIDIAFSWPVASTYKLQSEPGKRSRIERLEGKGLLSGQQIALGPQAAGPLMLTSVSRPTMMVRTADDLRFAVGLLLKTTDENLGARVLQLSTKYGMLLGKSEKKEVEPLALWAELAALLQLIFLSKDYFRWFPKANGKIGTLDVAIVRGKNEAARFVIRPGNLRDALIYRAAQMQAAGEDFRRCDWCTKPLVDKIASARFCSEECKTQFHNNRKKKR